MHWAATGGCAPLPGVPEPLPQAAIAKASKMNAKAAAVRGAQVPQERRVGISVVKPRVR